MAERDELIRTLRGHGMSKGEAAEKAGRSGSRPGRSVGGGGFEGPGAGAPTYQAEPPMPAQPRTADEMGGALDTGGPPREYGIGDQSSAGPFGDLIAGSDAHQLVKTVREDRLARRNAKAPTTTTPTFGDSIAQRTAEMEQAAMQPPPPDPAEVASQLAFLVDTRTGHFTPILPGEDPPQPGPHDILMKVDPQNPSVPNILAQGKSVTAASLSRLSNPQRNMQPTLHPNYQIPPQYAQLAQAMGVKT